MRHFILEDAQLIMMLNGEASTRRWLPSHVYASHDDAVAALIFLVTSYSTPGHPRLGPYVLAIDHSSTGRLIGHLGFSPLGEEIEVSYAIAEASRGHGYATEALTHACGWIADAYGVPSILAVTATENAASRRTLERASFVRVGDNVMSFQGAQQAVSRYRWKAYSDIHSGA